MVNACLQTNPRDAARTVARTMARRVPTLSLLLAALALANAPLAEASSRPEEDAKAPSRSFLTTFIASVRHHRRSLAGDGRFVVHMVGALRAVEGRVSWPYAGYEACDRTTVVLVGRQMPDTDPKRDRIDGCEVRHVRGEWSAAALERGLPDERERRPDLVMLFNADAYACPWRRTLHALLQPRDDLRLSIASHRLGGPSGAPVVVTTYAANEARAVQRIVSNPEQWFTKDKLEECDAMTRTLYGADDERDDDRRKDATSQEAGGEAHQNGQAQKTRERVPVHRREKAAEAERGKEAGDLPMPRPALLHWRAGPNDPEENGDGTANSHWVSFSPGEVFAADRHAPTVERDWQGR